MCWGDAAVAAVGFGVFCLLTPVLKPGWCHCTCAVLSALQPVLQSLLTL